MKKKRTSKPRLPSSVYEDTLLKRQKDLKKIKGIHTGTRSRVIHRKKSQNVFVISRCSVDKDIHKLSH